MQRTSTIVFSLLLCSAVFLFPSPSSAQDISIKYASGREKDNLYLVDINLELELDEKIVNALRHGVSLELNIDLEIRQQRNWIWDKLVEEASIEFRLEHHPLSDDYIISNISDGSREQFQTLDEALKYLGTIRDYPATVTRKLDSNSVYLGLVRAELNIEELPPPLQPVRYVSSEWHLESQWYEWIIR